MPVGQWHSIIDAELEDAEALLDAGTPRAQVYGVLMRDAVTQETAKSKRRAGEPDPSVTYRMPTDERPTLGPEDALVTLVVFSDFQCPFCARLGETVHEITSKHPDVRVVFRNMPLANHPRARDAARAALAAARQNKFWEMHDLMFTEQKTLGDADFTALAERLGLDTDQFASDMADPEIERLVAEDEALAGSFGIQATPSSFVNGRFVRGAPPLAAYESLIAEERSRAQALVDAGTAPSEVYARIMETAATSVAKGDG
jgi:protein-disulfide isomerase